MAFGCEVHDIVELVIREQLIGQTAVANITFYEVAAFVVDIFGDSGQIACIRQGVKHYYPDVVVFGQDVFQIIGTDKSGCSCD